MKEGCSGKLKSTIPPITFPAWPAMLSGKNPGKLGFIDFTKKVGDKEFDFVGPEMFKGQLLWDILNEKGIKVGVVDFPEAFGWKINGFIIHGYSPELLDIIHPLSLKEEIITNFKKLPVVLESVSDEKRKETILENTRLKFDLLTWLLKREDWDVLVFLLSGPDEIMHHATDEASIFSVYKIIDDEFSKIVQFCEDKNIFLFVVSDHGCKLVENEFCINKWLEEEELLFPKKRKIHFFENFLDQLVSYLLKKGFRANLRFFARIVKKTTGKELRRSGQRFLDNIDWQKTKLYGFTSSVSSFMGLWLNRYRKTLNKNSCEEAINIDLERIVGKLKRLVDPNTGKKVIKNVFSRNELYHGPYVDTLPDLIIEASDDYAMVSGIHSWLFGRTKSYIHSLYGVVFAHGPNIKRGIRISNAEIFDITPTVLHLLDLPVPTDIDGKVLKDIYSEDSQLFRRPVKYRKPIEKREEIAGLSDKEKKRIKERLRKLGYLE